MILRPVLMILSLKKDKRCGHSQEKRRILNTRLYKGFPNDKIGHGIVNSENLTMADLQDHWLSHAANFIFPCSRPGCHDRWRLASFMCLVIRGIVTAESTRRYSAPGLRLLSWFARWQRHSSCREFIQLRAMSANSSTELLNEASCT